MVPIDICIANNNIEKNLTNHITIRSKMEMKNVKNHDENITINNLLHLTDNKDNQKFCWYIIHKN